MTLLDAPNEVLQEVVVLVIHTVGLDEAMKLRFICREINPPWDYQPNY
jgi:hypothetical protein